MDLVGLLVLQVTRNSVNPTRKRLISWVDHMENSYDLIYIYSHQFFKINHLFGWCNDGGNTHHFVKTHIYNSINIKYYLRHIV
jgi:hypothetical protein